MKRQKYRAKHYIIRMCFPSNLSASSSENDLEQSFFGEVSELAEVAP